MARAQGFQGFSDEVAAKAQLNLSNDLDQRSGREMRSTMGIHMGFPRGNSLSGLFDGAGPEGSGSVCAKTVAPREAIAMSECIRMDFSHTTTAEPETHGGQ